MSGEETINSVREKIQFLASCGELELPKAMEELHRLLNGQPDLVGLLLPEDTGQMVAALRKMRTAEMARLGLDNQGTKKKGGGGKKKKEASAPVDVEALLGELGDL